MRSRIGRNGDSWALAAGGVLIVAAAVALAMRGHREATEPAVLALLAGFVAAQAGLAMLAWRHVRDRGRPATLATWLLTVPPLVVGVSLAALWLGAPWEVSGIPGFVALLAMPVGWTLFAVVAGQAGLLSGRVVAGVLWALLLLLLFEAYSMRALAAVPLGLAWLLVGLLIARPVAVTPALRPAALGALAVVVLASAGLTAFVKSTARPAGVPGPAPTATTLPVAIDTDALPDDWMAITYLLARPDVDVRAITVTGPAVLGCADGQRQVLRLLALFGRSDIPVACGRTTLTGGGHPFPSEWRQGNLDLMREVTLPEPLAAPDPRPATEVLLAVLAASPEPLTIVALGPLTNLLDAFVADVTIRERVAEIVIMGGALDVGGNTGGGPAEWNVYVDPGAASFVFGAGRPIALIALDATSDAAATTETVEQIRAGASTPAQRFIADLLGAMGGTVAAGDYFFWDPLAAVVATDRRIAGFLTERLDVLTSGAESGRVVRSPMGGPVRIAVSADRAAFLRTFIDTLAAASP